MRGWVLSLAALPCLLRVVVAQERVENMPSGVSNPENVAILTVATALSFACCTGVAIRVWVAGSAPLPSFIAASQLTAVLTAAVATWLVTYTAGHNALNDQTVRLLRHTAKSVDSTIERELGVGVSFCLKLVAEVRGGVIDFDELYFPSSLAFLNAGENSLGTTSGSVAHWLFGHEDGTMYAFDRVLVGDDVKIGVSTANPALHCSPQALRDFGQPNSTCERARELRCDEKGCQQQACKDPVTGGCVFCYTQLGNVVDMETCPGCVPCDGYVRPTVDLITLPLGTEGGPHDWNLPSSYQRHQGTFCTTDEASFGPSALSTPGTNGVRWFGGPATVMSSDISPDRWCSFPFDPRFRPWYNRSDTLSWTDPYEFADNRQNAGITISLGVPNLRYRGTPYQPGSGTPADPRDSPWAGVVAVDFTFAVISKELKSQKPSENSVVILMGTTGLLVGSSLDTVARAGVDLNGDSILEGCKAGDSGLVCALSKDFVHHDIVQTVLGTVPDPTGTYEDVARVEESIVQGNDRVVLTRKVRVVGGLDLLLVIAMPYCDVIEDSQTAATRALGLAVGISLGSAALVCGIVVVVLRPLRRLARQMERVSVMDLPIDEHVGGVTSEVCAMSNYFAGMVESLTEYRAYLPIAVLQGALERSPSFADSIEPPTGTVAVLFTDVVSSTKMWEASPASMSDALETHNWIGRELISQCCGYEVKTIGDSFMVSFDQPAHALRFGVLFHQNLLLADWPMEDRFNDVLDTWGRQVSTEGDLVWHGITVRIGISFGEVQHEINPLTGRVDYRGRVVNLAARLEGAAQQGTVLVSEECMAAVHASGEHVGDLVFVQQQPIALKGLGMVRPIAVVPKALQARLDKLGLRPRAANNPLAGSPTGEHRMLSSSQISSGVRSLTSQSVMQSVSDRVKLVAAHGTVGVVTEVDENQSLGHNAPEFVFGTFQRRLIQLMAAATRTQGVMGSLFGASVQVTWNAVTSCTNHPSQGLIFASLSSRAALDLAIGIASGSILDGNVGLAKQKFHAVIGQTFVLAQSAASAAGALFTSCLACFQPEPPPVLQPFLRVVDTWGLLPTAAEPLIVPVYQPALDIIQGAHWELRDWDTDCVDSAGDGCPGYTQHYHAALQNGSVEAIDAISKSDESDETLRRVALLLREHVEKNPSGAKFRIPAPLSAPRGYDRIARCGRTGPSAEASPAGEQLLVIDLSP